MRKCFLKQKIRELESEIVNGRQAAKLAAKRIEELENYNRRAAADIKAYNACIDGMIAGESPCKWCEEQSECQLEAKGGKGCSEWWLMDIAPTNAEVEDSDSEGIYGSGQEG